MFQIRAEQFAAVRRKKIGDALIEQLGPVAGNADWDEQKHSVVLTDEIGNRGYVGFDNFGFMARYTSPLGRTWQLTNAPDGKLLDLISPSGHSMGLRYNTERVEHVYILIPHVADLRIGGCIQASSLQKIGVDAGVAARFNHSS